MKTSLFDEDDLAKRMADWASRADQFAAAHPKLARGQVWCRKCGCTQKVKSGECIRQGWPKCCGETMTIDSPDEQREYADAVSAKGE